MIRDRKALLVQEFIKIKVDYTTHGRPILGQEPRFRRGPYRRKLSIGTHLSGPGAEVCRRDLDGWMGGWMDARMDGWMDGWVDGWMNAWMDGWMHGWMDEWMDGWMAAWMDGWTYGSMHRWVGMC